MSTFQTLAADLDADLVTVEEVVEADVKIIWAALLPLLKTFAPSQMAIIIKAITDNLAAIIANPDFGFTAALADLAAQELAWWNTTEPQLQTTIINAVAALLAVPASAPASV